MLLISDSRYMYDMGENVPEEFVIARTTDNYCEKIYYTNEKIEYSGTFIDENGCLKNSEEFLKCKDMTSDISITLYLNLCNRYLFNLAKLVENGNIDFSESKNYMYFRLKDDSRYVYYNDGDSSERFNKIFEFLKFFANHTNEEYFFKIANGVYKTACCGAVVSQNFAFCPVCGKKLIRSDFKLTNERFDPDETVWLCSECCFGTPFRYYYCGSCGKRR